MTELFYQQQLLLLAVAYCVNPVLVLYILCQLSIIKEASPVHTVVLYIFNSMFRRNKIILFFEKEHNYEASLTFCFQFFVNIIITAVVL